MKLMVISLFLFILPGVHALQFDFSSPEEVVLNETFSVSISSSLESQDSYDVKIFIHKSQDKEILRSEIISDIYADKWQDSWLYILDSFPGENEYELRATNHSYSTELCVQLRKTGKTAYIRQCKSVMVNENTLQDKIIKKENKEIDNLTQSLPNNKSSIISEPNINEVLSNSDNAPIILNQPIQEFSTKQNKLNEIIICSSFIMAILTIILIIMKPRI